MVVIKDRGDEEARGIICSGLTGDAVILYLGHPYFVLEILLLFYFAQIVFYGSRFFVLTVFMYLDPGHLL